MVELVRVKNDTEIEGIRLRNRRYSFITKREFKKIN
ncbi:MAG: hypothetical protein RIT41_1487 [Bacteroidota bacterium]